MIIITNVTSNERMEHFYALVNKSGMRLNRPELMKAEYFDTRFMRLVEELSSEDKFVSLGLFTGQSLGRMSDLDFVSELIALLIQGITDKKLAVNDLLERDIPIITYKQTKIKFSKIIDILSSLNDIYLISDTRYRQRNDLYTLFGFLSNHLSLKQATLEYFYRVLVLIDEDISPAQEGCLPFKEYAYHCVTQSNSKFARQARDSFFRQLFLNKESTVNDTQKQVLRFYKLKNSDIERIQGYTQLSAKKLQEKVGLPLVVT